MATVTAIRDPFEVFKEEAFDKLVRLDAPGSVLRVAVCLLRHGNRLDFRDLGETSVWPSVETLAGKANLTRRAVFRALAWLARAGFVRRSGGVRIISKGFAGVTGMALKGDRNGTPGVTSRSPKPLKTEPLNPEPLERAPRVASPAAPRGASQLQHRPEAAVQVREIGGGLAWLAKDGDQWWRYKGRDYEIARLSNDPAGWAAEVEEWEEIDRWEAARASKNV